MKALVLTSLSGVDALAIQNVPEPAAKPGQTLVRVTAGGMNFADIMTTRGGYPGTPQPPLIVGREFAGIDESSGRRVMGYAQWAAFAEKTATHSNMIWPIPDHWTDEQAAAFPVNYFTAYLGYWQAGMTRGATWGEPAVPAQPPPEVSPPPVSPPPMWGQPPKPALSEVEGAVRRSEAPQRTPRVLIHAVAGGVVTAAVQIGKLLGVDMYGTSSSDEKHSRVKDLGPCAACAISDASFNTAPQPASRRNSTCAPCTPSQPACKACGCRTCRKNARSWSQPGSSSRHGSRKAN